MSQEQPIEIIDLTEAEASQESTEIVHDEENAIIEIIDDDDENMEQDIEVIEDHVIIVFNLDKVQRI